ncbi:MAG: hypothetical protein E3J72_22150 [Planctomycetota bacterium]|nr:MAG: hypothetical protein E3J72_22150 [Planctomycetota bacterium]
MNKYRWLVLCANFLLILTIIGLGLHFFGGLGVIVKYLFDTDKFSTLYFQDAPIPTWDPMRYRPQKTSKPKQRTIKKDYAFIAKEYVPEPDKPKITEPEAPKPPEAQVILDQRVKQVFSVVYSPTKPKENGCYLQTPVKDVGDRIYYYKVGDPLPDHGQGIGFKVKSVEEVEKDKKYKVVFVDAKGREATKEFTLSVPVKYDLKASLKKQPPRRRR